MDKITLRIRRWRIEHTVLCEPKTLHRVFFAQAPNTGRFAFHNRHLYPPRDKPTGKFYAFQLRKKIGSLHDLMCWPGQEMMQSNRAREERPVTERTEKRMLYLVARQTHISRDAHLLHGDERRTQNEPQGTDEKCNAKNSDCSDAEPAPVLVSA